MAVGLQKHAWYCHWTDTRGTTLPADILCMCASMSDCAECQPVEKRATHDLEHSDSCRIITFLHESWLHVSSPWYRYGTYHDVMSYEYGTRTVLVLKLFKNTRNDFKYTRLYEYEYEYRTHAYGYRTTSAVLLRDADIPGYETHILRISRISSRPGIIRDISPSSFRATGIDVR